MSSLQSANLTATIVWVRFLIATEPLPIMGCTLTTAYHFVVNLQHIATQRDIRRAQCNVSNLKTYGNNSERVGRGRGRQLPHLVVVGVERQQNEQSRLEARELVAHVPRNVREDRPQDPRDVRVHRETCTMIGHTKSYTPETN